MVAGRGDLQRMPGSGRRLQVGAPELDAPTVDDLVDAIVVFQVVLARDVIVLQVAVAPDRPTALILAAGDGTGPHSNRYVLEGRLIGNGDVEIPAGMFARY